jgi:ATP-binding cassette subfamily B protein
LFGFLEEHLAGTEDIRSSGATQYVMRGFFIRMKQLLQKALKAALMINILLNIIWFLFALGTATAFAISAYLFENTLVSMGTVYIIFMYTNMLERPIQTISRQLEHLQRASAGIIRIQELFNTQSKIKETPDPTVPYQPLIGREPVSVTFDQVSFGYDDSISMLKAVKNNGNGMKDGKGKPGESIIPMLEEKEIVLKNIHFHLPPGKVLGLLGRTGSGKTTLIRLLFRLFDVDEGRIMIASDGYLMPTDIRELPTSFLRNQVGLITQNIQLFNASVRDNLTFFDRTIDDETVLNAIHGLGLQPWFDALPEGLDTDLDSGGSSLSAGEAQLLAFTRIFLKDPGLIILDEASSRLDPATENLIERAVDNLVKERTAIIIAHRLNTVQRADEILILEDGQILEHSARKKLAADPSSHFYKLLQTGMEEVLV